MCNKCTPKAKYWLHIADDWTLEEKLEMVAYLIEQITIAKKGRCY